MSPMTISCTLAAMVLTTSCGGRREEPAAYLPVTDVESVYGKLITAGNHPTPNQNGTGERVGLFEGADGTVWGFPLVPGTNRTVLACAPSLVQKEAVTDT